MKRKSSKRRSSVTVRSRKRTTDGFSGKLNLRSSYATGQQKKQLQGTDSRLPSRARSEPVEGTKAISNLDKLKARTRCKICKEVGHWHKECSKLSSVLALLNSDAGKALCAGELGQTQEEPAVRHGLTMVGDNPAGSN